MRFYTNLYCSAGQSLSQSGFKGVKYIIQKSQSLNWLILVKISQYNVNILRKIISFQFIFRNNRYESRKAGHRLYCGIYKHALLVTSITYTTIFAIIKKLPLSQQLAFTILTKAYSNSYMLSFLTNANSYVYICS